VELNSFETTITIPSGYKGDYQLVAAVPYLVGVSILFYFMFLPPLGCIAS
jgi:hypothetical protein